MTVQRIPAVLVLVALSSAAVAQTSATSAPAVNCRVVRQVAKPGDSITWDGKCKDGFAEGAGKLSVQSMGEPKRTYEANLIRGEIVGEATLKWPNGATYIGTFRDGKPGGKGYFKYADGRQYEGDVANGVPEGSGTEVDAYGSRYDGQWKGGLRDGMGRTVYVLGGAYEGQWKNGKREGKGVITYAGSGHKQAGEFHDGLLVGTQRLPEPTVDRYALKGGTPPVGSHLPEHMGMFKVPPGKDYADLTPEQQDYVKWPYLALEEGDQPPYPLQGVASLVALLRQAATQYQSHGRLGLLVDIGADGVATAVTVVRAPDPDLRDFASAAVLEQKYKPAVCRGKPCAMKYPVFLTFEAR